MPLCPPSQLLLHLFLVLIQNTSSTDFMALSGTMQVTNPQKLEIFKGKSAKSKQQICNIFCDKYWKAALDAQMSTVLAGFLPMSSTTWGINCISNHGLNAKILPFLARPKTKPSLCHSILFLCATIRLFKGLTSVRALLSSHIKLMKVFKYSIHITLTFIHTVFKDLKIFIYSTGLV